MPLSSEHRLLHYVKPKDKTRYNSRTADLNAERQAAERAESLGTQQAQAASQFAAAGNDSAASKYQQEAQGFDTQAQAYDPQALANVQTVYNAPDGVTYDPQTGITAPTNDPREPAPTTMRERSEARGQARVQAGLQPSGGEFYTPEQAAQINAARAQEETELLKQQDIESERQERRASSSAAGAAASQKAQKAAQDAPLQDTSKLDRMSNILDGIIAATGDPMGPVYKEMMLQDMQDREDAEANAALSLDASIERADEQYDDTRDIIDQFMKVHRENNERYTQLLDETRDAQQKYLAEQEERDLERLAWEGDRETQKLTKQKTAQLLSQSIQNALGGGAFSGAASEQLAQTERDWDRAISDLAKEYSFKKTDVSAFYTQKYIDTNNQLNLDVFNAAKELDEKIEGYAIQGFNSLQARENAEIDAANAYRATIDSAKKAYSDKIQGYVKEMHTTLRDERKAKLDQQNALWDRLFEQRSQDGNLNPGFTQQILDQMEKAGINTSGIDPYAMTTSQVNDLHRRALEEAKAQRDANGRPMTAGQAKELADIDNSLSLLDGVKTSMLVDFKDVGGPIAGRLGSIPGSELFNEGAMRQREFEAQVNLVKQIIGKALEGGVLRKEDEVKYEKILPNIKDTDRIRATKISQLEREIKAKKAGLLQNLSLSGYNTSGYDFGDPLESNEVPRVTDDEAQQILERIESGEPLSLDAPNAGTALASLGTSQTQGFTTPIGTNLYSPATIKAWNGQHKGIDIAMPPGTPLPAVVPGKVISAGYQDGWGNTVVIRAEDGSEHRYSHLDAINVKPGSAVTKGQTIALSGGAKGAKGAGTSTGPHLDYRVKVNGKYIDPYSYTIS